MTLEARQSLLFGLAILACWEAFGDLTRIGHAALPAPSRILAQFWLDRDLYGFHVAATMRSAALGFLAGVAVALLAAVTFARFPTVERLFRGVNIALFAMPAIVVGPILVIVFDGDLPQIILAALLVYYPTMAATLVGLRTIDPRLCDVIGAYGGREGALMRFVRLRSSLPSLLAGLRVAASLAVLGAILGEFGSGRRWGLGSLLLGSLGQGNPARLWGIGLAATTLALAGYALFAALGARALSGTRAVTLAPSQPPDGIASAAAPHGAWRGAAVAVASALLPFVLWWLLLKTTRLSPIIAPGPIETLSFLLAGPEAVQSRAVLGAALAQTLPVAALGLASGLATAFVLAALSVLRPALARAVLPVALVAQNIPLVALVPIVLLLAGRGLAASVLMAVLVVFFPAFVLMAQGFALVPAAARDLVAAYGGGRGRQLVLVSIPYATRHLFAAAKLVAPQALLGVMVAEWLLSGVGIGNLLNVSRGVLDYDMIWAGALVSILIAVAAYEAVCALERIFA